MASPQFVFQQRWDFALSSDRLAQVWTVADIGAFARDVQTGVTYMVMAAGSGAATMSPLTRAGGEQRRLGIPISNLRLVSSGNDVGNIAAIGGVGASDSDPIFRGDAAGSYEWSWANGAHVGALGCDVSLPDDYDGSRDVTVELDVYSGSSDAATFTFAYGADGAAEASASVSDAATKSATRHTITATLTAPGAAKELSIRLTPAAHATNAIQLCRVALKFYTK